MNPLKKEVLLIVITCALGTTSLLLGVIRHPDYISPENVLYSVEWFFSGYQGLLWIMGTVPTFFYKPSWMLFVNPFLACLSFPLTMIFSKKIFVVKRVAFSYFITMYVIVILSIFFDYLLILKII